MLVLVSISHVPSGMLCVSVQIQRTRHLLTIQATKNATDTECDVPFNDDSGTIMSLAPALTAVALAFVIIRLVARWNALGCDDGCVVAGWLTGLVVAILNSLMGLSGLGKDIWTVPFDEISRLLFLFYITE